MSSPVFLSARWKHLVLVNYEINPDVLTPHLPQGTTLDFYEGKTYVSLVAFLFENTKIFGLIPAFFHRDFEEVNLRFYVTRNDGKEIKRGVVFVKEIVPKPILAWVARTFYSENYVSMDMDHQISEGSDYLYRWGQHKLNVHSAGKLNSASAHSLERWITEHYWGYTKVNDSTTLEYEVKHPVWNLYEVDHNKIDVDVPSLYGSEFSTSFSKGPASLFLADGSEVSVHWPLKLSLSQKNDLKLKQK